MKERTVTFSHTIIAEEDFTISAEESKETARSILGHAVLAMQESKVTLKDQIEALEASLMILRAQS